MIPFFKNKRILITGHTGFKGSWLSKILLNSGANLLGYALEPATNPNMFTMLGLSNQMQSVIGDIRDLGHMKQVFQDFQPEIVIHLAAQPLVRESYQNPHYTYETNVMGTVNFFECVRLTPSIKSVLNVTTDKVYLNNEWDYGYREIDILNGFDPYSNSKSCSELVTDSYRRSFFQESMIPISTARAGNVIGGGDFATDRIIPDCVRAMKQNEPLILRNPYSTRPYQHVLEPLYAYLLIIFHQYHNHSIQGAYNVGPEEEDSITTKRLVELFYQSWDTRNTWSSVSSQGPHEANFLKLDCSMLKSHMGWKPQWTIQEAVHKTVEWSKKYLNQEDMNIITDQQIRDYEVSITALFEGLGMYE